MDFAVDAFRSTPPFDILAKLFGQPEHTDWLDESLSWKPTCYIGDWSFLPQTRFRGPGVPELFSGISVNCFRRFPVGASKHVVQTNTHGHVMNEGILTRLDEEDYVFHGPGGDWARYNLEHGDFPGDPGDPVKRIRATVAQAPYKPVRSRVDLRVHLARYRAEFGAAA